MYHKRKAILELGAQNVKSNWLCSHHFLLPNTGHADIHHTISADTVFGPANHLYQGASAATHFQPARRDGVTQTLLLFGRSSTMWGAMAFGDAPTTGSRGDETETFAASGWFGPDRGKRGRADLRVLPARGERGEPPWSPGGGPLANWSVLRPGGSPPALDDRIGTGRRGLERNLKEFSPRASAGPRNSPACRQKSGSGKKEVRLRNSWVRGHW
jgi:hypothetical protein